MKFCTRSSVAMVMPLPPRKRATNLPSLTARRPKVDSAIAQRRQYASMSSNSARAASAMPHSKLQNASVCQVPTKPGKPKVGYIPTSKPNYLEIKRITHLFMLGFIPTALANHRSRGCRRAAKSFSANSDLYPRPPSTVCPPPCHRKSQRHRQITDCVVAPPATTAEPPESKDSRGFAFGPHG